VLFGGGQRRIQRDADKARSRRSEQGYDILKRVEGPQSDSVTGLEPLALQAMSGLFDKIRKLVVADVPL
jgi:hypothetical protein